MKRVITEYECIEGGERVRVVTIVDHTILDTMRDTVRDVLTHRVNLRLRRIERENERARLRAYERLNSGEWE